MVTDPIADLLTRIRNAQRIGRRTVRVRSSNLGRSILDVLKDEGFIDTFEVTKDAQDQFDECEVALKYFGKGNPAIKIARRVSTPGRRVYKRTGDLPRVDCGLGISIVSTSQGVLSDREARKRKIGGEVLALVSC